MQWFSQAPSNIALIKYMGKKDEANNIPDNPSLSYTLNQLLSSVVLETTQGKKDFWEPLEIPGAGGFTLSQAAQLRFLDHLARLKAHFHYSGAFIVRSSNNFPHSSGLASSASSFAALTKCAVLALSELTNEPLPSIETQAQLSRLGSGSSCRSFFAPWALWQEDEVSSIQLPYQELEHQVIIISHDEKKVSSKEAHRRIKTSTHYPTRPQRAKENLKVLLTALEAKDWESAYQVCWREFHDMHQLFMTCKEPFSYMTENTHKALHSIQDLWQREGDGPITTMDAGPNIHLLYRPEQVEMAMQFKRDHLVGNYDVL
ncbi:diphosphomevalonate/mevalonate 3,5-bisphosphate decarboxylase family protein [Legionella jamestowniensis]|uniref:Diphosphomevalonate decarboxylase n=1 Tax=Legionella jamestowniensis TaxID=455 RepID=A0A0W0UYP9_9GAMM|nr:diphosphomevalonate decarboxylase [Legionella jamestowniensis]KTD12968.1 mevalonate diphosphate decarboxylase [Legionella jamestowniensis]OCH98245.1 diphosphomevalonate decarboxylase [Legionella jamestowniensis]SFL78817.1 diphosphomevalonate decarboxylase [Legionella jamestowniensis DSM 19215]